MRCRFLVPAVLAWAMVWCPSSGVAQSTSGSSKSGGTLLDRLDDFGRTIFGAGRTSEKDAAQKAAATRTAAVRRDRVDPGTNEPARPRAGSGVSDVEPPAWGAVGQTVPAALPPGGGQSRRVIKTAPEEEPTVLAQGQAPTPAGPNVPGVSPLHERMSGLRRPLFGSEGEPRVAERNIYSVPARASGDELSLPPSPGGLPPLSPAARPNPVAPVFSGPSMGPAAGPLSRAADPAAPKPEGTTAPGRSPAPGESGGVLLTRQSPSLSVEAVGARRIAMGKEAAYEIVVHNSGPVTAEQVMVTVGLPEYIEVLATEASAGTAESAKGKDEPRQIVWKVGRLEAKARQRLLLRIVPRQNRQFDLAVKWDCAAISSQAMIEVQEPKLSIALQGPREVQFGKGEIYRLEISNTGNGDAENVAISLTPAGPGEKQAPASHRFGPLAPGQRKSIDVELTARQTGDLLIQVEARADGGVRAELAEKIAVRRATLKVEIDAPAVHFIGSEASYRIRVSNPGSAPAKNVALTATLPSGTKYISSPQAARQVPEQNAVTWTLESLGAGAETTLVMNCDTAVPGTSKLEVRCKADGDLNATASASTQVEAMANLVLTVEDPTGPVLLGSEATYVIHVQNRGSASAVGVEVLAFFSNGFEPISVEGARHKVSPGQVLFEAIASLAAGQSVALKVKAKAEGAGNHVFRVEVRSEPAGTRLVREGTTRFYGTIAAAPTSASPSSEKPAASSSAPAAETRTADRRDATSGSKADPPAAGTTHK